MFALITSVVAGVLWPLRQTSIYTSRTAGGHCDHRHPRCLLLPAVQAAREAARVSNARTISSRWGWRCTSTTMRTAVFLRPWFIPTGSSGPLSFCLMSNRRRCTKRSTSAYHSTMAICLTARPAPSFSLSSAVPAATRQNMLRYKVSPIEFPVTISRSPVARRREIGTICRSGRADRSGWYDVCQ